MLAKVFPSNVSAKTFVNGRHRRENGKVITLDRWEHSRGGSDWVDDIKCHPKGVLSIIKFFSLSQCLSASVGRVDGL